MSNRILVISRRNAFICIHTIFVPKLAAMVTPLRPLCTGVSQMNSPMAQNQTLHGCVAYKRRCGHFCDFGLFWPKFGCHGKCLISICRPLRHSVISNRVLVIIRRNAFMCIYSNFCPKIGCHSNAPLSLVYGTDEFLDGTNPISKPSSAWMCRLQLKLWQFL